MLDSAVLSEDNKVLQSYKYDDMLPVCLSQHEPLAFNRRTGGCKNVLLKAKVLSSDSKNWIEHPGYWQT